MHILAAGVQWGTVSDWISGVATAIAVIIALIFSLRAERQEQADKLAAVHAWLAVDQEGGVEAGNLWLVNSTDSPIYEWQVDLSWPTDTDAGGVQMSIGSDSYGLLPPGRYPFPVREHVVLPANDAHVSVELRFRDAAGKRRRRLPSGRLGRQ